MPFENPGLVAGGDIRPNRFVKLSTSADNTVLEADANELTFGVSSEATQDAPIDGASANAAEATDPLEVKTVGQVAKLEIGSGGVTRGAFVKSDADGKGVLAATTGATAQNIGAQALESASEGELANVLIVMLPKYYPALT